jgi:hypothetical protein
MAVITVQSPSAVVSVQVCVCDRCMLIYVLVHASTACMQYMNFVFDTLREQRTVLCLACSAAYCARDTYSCQVHSVNTSHYRSDSYMFDSYMCTVLTVAVREVAMMPVPAVVAP